MNEKNKALEFKVGLFVFTGLMVIAAMVVRFGQIGQGFSSYYDLTIQFSNAAGIIKRADVQLAGARIGYVDNKPEIGQDATRVDIHLKIKEGTVIPKATTFQVNSSGLMGDKFVEVVPDEKFDPASYNPKDPAQIRHPGEVIRGTDTTGLQELQKKGEDVLDQARGTIVELREVARKINSDLLNEANSKNFSATIANLKSTSESFANTSRNANEVLANMNSVMLTTKEAVEGAKKSMATIDQAAGEVRKTVADGRKVFDNANSVLRLITQGDGLVTSLLNDNRLANDLTALSSNLRKHGILFYRDSKDSEARPAPAPVPNNGRSPLTPLKRQ